MGNCVSLQISCDQALNQSCGCLFGERNYILMMESNLEVLQKTMQELKEKREDLLRRVSIEEGQGLQRLAQVQGWFSRVETVESQVNDLLEAKSTQTKRLCLCGFCSGNLVSSYDYGKKVYKELKEVEALIAKCVFKVVAEKIPTAKGEKKHIQTTVGLDSMVEKAWKSLMNGENITTTLGLYGMGGVGKTTLLARINNKFLEVVNEFDVVIWVVVSKDLQIEGIQKQILGSLGLVDKEWKQETEKEKASRIYNILNRRRFMLLLDDLWSEVDLNKIGVPPLTQENRCKMVFTTRSKEVCKEMEVDDEMEVVCLSPGEAWELFQKKVGETPLKSHQDIPILARKVAEKCCGLPLALNVIGKAMACKESVQEWQHVLNVLNLSSHKFPGMAEKILPILKFSYDSLKDENAKTCFLYCSLFPEDYEIGKEELIEYWICEGLIDGDCGDNNQGHDIIGLLVRTHLLMDCELTTKVKMHDVIREMALWIGNKKELESCVKSGAQLCHIPTDINWENVRRVSLMSNHIEELSCSFHCPNLSTLLLRKNKLVDISGEIFQFMPALVVLDLSKNKSLIELPEEISNLGSLQYLNLSYTGIKCLPVGIKELKKLINLNLEFTFELQSIVGISTSLPNLQVLKLFYSRVCVDDRLMEELQLLEHLKILTATVDDAMVLKSLQGIERLASCTRALCLKNMSATVVMLNTVALDGLQRLAIVNSKLSEIKIDCERRERGGGGFKNLSTVYIVDLEGPKDLSWLLFAQNVKYLFVARSSKIREIINREKGMSISNVHPGIVVPFGKLELLKVSDMDELRRIFWNPPTLPNLRQFGVQNCPKLSRAATKFPRLERGS
ncbi:putative disease resistance protein [Cardamine amara subsp. amara]|uniref:Disease resistance protein n=1 Tax=Cardamine amara subsp. amara TaxID=228776 RepID=A0ABD1BJC1_CARAN